jgi:hypothetical protein
MRRFQRVFVTPRCHTRNVTPKVIRTVKSITAREVFARCPQAKKTPRSTLHLAAGRGFISADATIDWSETVSINQRFSNSRIPFARFHRFLRSLFSNNHLTKPAPQKAM